jgi:medium-chain acyl-[acyl-carrier-protein] hydrolase
MGALMAYEVARRLVASRMKTPAGLIVSGCEAPTRLRPKRLHTALDDDGLIQALGRFNGVPPEVLQHRELMKLVLPTLRADLAMVEGYRHAPGLKLGLPIEVLAGTSDPLVDSAGLDGWSEATTGTCRVHWIDGDHFFINSQRGTVLRLIRQCLTPPVECASHPGA